MSTAVTMTPAVAEKLAAYQRAQEQARAELMALITTQTGAPPADPAPVDPPAPAKKSGGKKKAATAVATPAAPVPTGPVLVQPKPKAPKPPAAPKAPPAAKPVVLEVRPWTGDDGQKWACVAIAGRRKGQNFNAKERALAHAWLDAVARDVAALKVLIDTALVG